MPISLQQLLAAFGKTKDPEALQALRDAFPAKSPIPPDIDENGNVLVQGNAPEPPAFRKDPPIVGLKTADNYRVLTHLIPQLKGSATRIVEGPTKDTIVQMVASGLPPQAFEGTNLGGSTNLDDHTVAINPEDASNPSTLLHELSHTKGYGEPGAQIMQELYKRATGMGHKSNAGALDKVLPMADLSMLRQMLAASKEQ